MIVADDFFRSAANGLHCHDNNRRFLLGLFKSTFTRLGIRVREASAMLEGGEVDVRRLMLDLGLPATPEGWAAACIADLMPILGRHGMPHFGPGCLVIGWGLSPALLRCIDRSGASFIDIEVDPVRFATHLNLCARTNDRMVASALDECRVDREEFWNHASATRALFARRGKPHLFDEGLRVGVFFGQSVVDLSLVSGGRTLHPVDVLDEIERLADSVDLLVIKPHPCEAALHHLAPVMRAVPHVAWTQQNTYALLAAENVAFACSLSSGVLVEATYFMKPAISLIHPDRNTAEWLPAACTDWMPVGASIASMKVMSAACGRAAANNATARWPEEALDLAFQTRWGMDPAAEGLRELPVADLGRRHGFAAGGDATPWLSHGWSTPDASGVWTDGEQACLVIPLPDALQSEAETAGRSLELAFDCAPLRGVAKVPRVTAIVDGVTIPPTPGSAHGLPKSFRIELPRPRAASGAPLPLVVQFSIQNPQRPCDIGRGSDTRRLGFALKSLRLAVHPAPTASVDRSVPQMLAPSRAHWISKTLDAWAHRSRTAPG